jgi:phosphoribosylformylglycinamidine cyclo-ligase
VVGHSLSLEQVAELVEGAAEICREAGCALLGGETAEMPGVYREEELDFAGTCVGLVEREAVIDGSRIEAGDVVLGFPSLGLHTNGFSLVRKLVGDGDFDADLLLAPHKLYVNEVRALRERADVKALAHVTGGGILGNLSRVLPEGRAAEIDWDSWERPPVYDWLTAQGVSEEEQRKVFNVGIGMCAVVPASDAGAGRVIGRVV